MNFELKKESIAQKKIKLQEIVMVMKHIVDSLTDDVKNELPENQSSTPVRRNLCKNNNEFYYKLIDFDDETILKGCKMYEKEEYISLNDLIDSITIYEKYLFDTIDDHTTKSSTDIQLSKHTTSSNAYLIKFELSSQVDIILNGLRDINMFINYNKCPYIHDLLYLIKLIVLHNKDHAKIDLRSVSNRIDIITNLYN